MIEIIHVGHNDGDDDDNGDDDDDNDDWHFSPRAQPLSGWPADLFCWQSSPFNP